MKLTDIAPAEEWESPFIRKVYDGDLTLYTYTQEAMYTPGAWDSAAVRAARGLITYKDEVIARPFDKFFNYGQPGAARVALGEPVTVSDKVDGCFPRGTVLNLWDGGTIKIDDVVKNKLTPTLIGMDEEGNLVPSKVTDWHDNGIKNNWMAVGLSNLASRSSGAGGHPNRMVVTPNHHVYVQGEYVPAGELQVGDVLTTYASSYDNLDLFVGGLLGDGSVCKSGNDYNYQECHGETQRQYVYDMRGVIDGGLTNVKDTRGGYANTTKVWVSTQTSPVFTRLREEWYPDGVKKVPDDLTFLNDAVVAKWYMDDGSRVHHPSQNDRITLFTNGFSKSDVSRLATALETLYGVTARVAYSKGWYIRVNWAKGSINNLWSAMAPYIFPSMDYKLPPEFRGQFTGFPKARQIKVPVESVVTSIEYDLDWYGNNYGRSGARAYDIETETHNYMCKGVLVHNSLGISYYHPQAQEYRIATRGSFTSEQALHATKVLHEKYPDFKPVEGYTYLFEIVYPENRIVLDYGDTDDLILLNIRNIATGEYYPSAWGNWKGPKAEYVAFPTFESVLTSPPRENAEGFVVMTRRGEFLKVKQEDYLLKHKLVFGLSKKRIWEQMQETSLEDMLKAIPDEFHTQVMEWHAELEYDYHELDEQVWLNFMDLAHVWDDRKAFALEVKDHPFRAFMFRLLDRKPIDDMLYKYIEPKG